MICHHNKGLDLAVSLCSLAPLALIGHLLSQFLNDKSEKKPLLQFRHSQENSMEQNGKKRNHWLRHRMKCFLKLKLAAFSFITPLLVIKTVRYKYWINCGFSNENSIVGFAILVVFISSNHVKYQAGCFN